MEDLIRAGGVYCCCFVIFHLLFWRFFHWDEDLRSLSTLNRAIVQVINLSLTFCFVIFGYLSVFHTQELIDSSLGHSLLLLIALFWLLRAIQQIIFFKLKDWGSIVFFFIFLTGFLLYGVPAIIVA